MKKIILIISIASLSLGAFSQTKKAKPVPVKPDSTKKAKQYTLYFIVDSAGYLQIIQNIRKVEDALEASTAPHNQVQADQLFLMQINNIFVEEKKAQDQPVKK